MTSIKKLTITKEPNKDATFLVDVELSNCGRAWGWFHVYRPENLFLEIKLFLDKLLFFMKR